MSGRRHQKRFDLGWAVLCVFVGLVFTFLVTPLLIVFPLSFSSAPYLQFPPPGFSLQWYERFLGDYAWMSATVRSFQVGGAVVLLSLLLATPLSISLVRGRFWGRGVLERLIMSPMIVPTIVMSVGIYNLFSQLKLIGSWYGLAIAHTILALPFVTITLTAGLRGLDKALEDAAVGLGANSWTILRRIILPQIMPSLISASLLAFITSFDDLIVAMFLSGSRMTLPKKMFDNILVEVDPTIAAISVLQILMVIVAFALAAKFGKVQYARRN